jgi:hypothetical protein
MNQIPDVVIGALFRQIVFKICCNARRNSRPAVTLIIRMTFGSGPRREFRDEIGDFNVPVRRSTGIRRTGAAIEVNWRVLVRL